MLVLKVWADVVDENLGERPFDPEDVLREREEAEFDREAIGYLTTPVDIPGWIARVRLRFTFLRHLDELEQQISRCSRGEEWLVRREIENLAGRAVPESDSSALAPEEEGVDASCL